MKPAPLSSFLLATLASAVSATAPAVSSTMTGFTASGAAEQRALEARFDAALDPADLRAWMQTLAAGPNHVGAPHNRENAEYVRDLFREWGWKAEIERFDVLYPTPKRTSLEMVAPTAFKAALAEPPVAGDASTAKPGALPPYNIYGADGDVTIYTPGADRRAMFELPRYVIKGGEVVVEQGEIRKDVLGRSLYVAPEYDEGVVPDIQEWFKQYYTIQFANYPVDAHHLPAGGQAVACRR